MSVIIDNTVRVGELPPSDFNLTDNLPHEVGTDLNRGTVQQLAEVIGNYLGATNSLAFNPTTVGDGGTLPSTTSNEWLLAGIGTFHNVGGAPDIVTTEELNAITSNGSYWSLAVQIPINVEFAGITQSIRSGYTQTTPSEDAVYNAFLGKLSTGGYTGTANDIVNLISASSFPKIQFTADGVTATYSIGVTAKIKAVFWNGALLNDLDWSQTGTTFTLTFIPTAGDLIKPI